MNKLKIWALPKGNISLRKLNKKIFEKKVISFLCTRTEFFDYQGIGIYFTYENKNTGYIY